MAKERPLSDDRERREQREQAEVIFAAARRWRAAFQQTLEGRGAVAIVVATSARLPMVVADLGGFLRAGVGVAGLGWLGLPEKAITPLGYDWPPRARV